MSVSCSLHFPCVVHAHPLDRELRLRIPIQTRAQRGQPSGALGDDARPRVVRQRHLLLDASAAPRGRRRLLPRATAVWFPALTSRPRCQRRLSRSPEKAWREASRCGPGR